MNTFVYFVCFVRFLYGHHSENSTTTLELSEHPCDNYNNDNDTLVKFETVSYDDIDDIQDDTMALLSNGDKVRLSDYGVIEATLTYDGCYRLEDNNENHQKILELRKVIQTETMHQTPLKRLDRIYDIIHGFHGCLGLISGLKPCRYIPINCRDLVFHYTQADRMKCIENDNLNNNTSGDIHLEVFIPHIIMDIWNQEKGRYVLCNYIVNGKFKTPVDHFSDCTLPTDGSLCDSEDNNEDFKYCEYVSFKRGYICVAKHQPDASCSISRRVCGYRKFYSEWKRSQYDYVNHLMEQYSDKVYSVNRYNRQYALILFNKPNNYTQCVSLKRDVDRLFVQTDNCHLPMRYLCKKITYIITETIHNTTVSSMDTSNDALHSTLVIICVSLFITIIVAFTLGRAVRRYCRRNYDIQHGSDAIELDSTSVASDHYDCVSGRMPNNDDVSGQMAVVP